jgi:hypothetical protein
VRGDQWCHLDFYLRYYWVVLTRGWFGGFLWVMCSGCVHGSAWSVFCLLWLARVLTTCLTDVLCVIVYCVLRSLFWCTVTALFCCSRFCLICFENCILPVWLLYCSDLRTVSWDHYFDTLSLHYFVVLGFVLFACENSILCLVASLQSFCVKIGGSFWVGVMGSCVRPRVGVGGGTFMAGGASRVCQRFYWGKQLSRHWGVYC